MLELNIVRILRVINDVTDIDAGNKGVWNEMDYMFKKFRVGQKRSSK